jgi:mannose-1-phosphate guanylyltransferase
LLLAGGAGTRLWPLSTEKRPKPFLKLREGRSLLHDAYARVHGICDEEVFVATAEQYADLTLSELKTMSSDKLILEPSRRNTGPALLCAALRFERDGDPVTVALPADQTVAADDVFRACLRAAAAIADSEKVLVTLGVVATRPETDFGYIQVNRESALGPGYRVNRFVEKPDRETAERFLSSGGFYWNAGILVFKPSALLSEAESACPELLEACRRYDEKWRERNDRAERTAYAAIPSISIDYAVMEKASRVYCVPFEAGWSDVGTYRALKELQGVDGAGNLILSDRPVLAVGVTDSVIASTEEGTLVLAFSQEGELRGAVEQMEQKGRG